MKICIITTGGTIVSQKNEHSALVPGLDIRQMVEEVCKCIEISGENDSLDISFSYVDLLSKDSTDIGPDDWIIISDKIKEKTEYSDAFIITHGTDTMAYTAAALRLLLGDFSKIVVLTGSMLPFDAAGSDAISNMKNAITIALSQDLKGIYISFDGKLYDALNVTKVDSTGFDAFEAPLDGRHIYPVKDRKINRAEIRDPRSVQLIKLYPGVSTYIFEKILSDIEDDKSNEEGIVYPGSIILETPGAGGVPEYMVDILRQLKMCGVDIYVKSSCLYGGSDLARYEVGRRLLDIGAKDLGNVTTEYAVAGILLGVIG